MREAFLRLFLGSLFGKALGLVREVALAAAYGTGAPVAANRVGQGATLIPVNFLTADALNAGFLPMHAQLRRTDPERADALYRCVQLYMAGAAIVVSAGLITFAPTWTSILAPGFSGETRQLTINMVRVFALGVPFYLHSGLLGFLEMSNGAYTLYSLRSSVQSIGMMLGIVAAWASRTPEYLAWGFTGSCMVLSVWSEVRLRRRGMVPSLRGAYSGERTRPVLAEFWRRMRPLLWLPVFAQGSIAIERAVGSLISESTVAATDYARFIIDSGTAVLAAPLGVASLATLTLLPERQLRESLDLLIGRVLLITGWASLALALVAKPLVQLLFARGHFNAHAVDTSARILLGFAIGFWAQVLAYTLVKALNARNRNRQAALASGAGFLVGIVVNLVFYRVLGAIVLGVAVSAGSIATLVVAAIALRCSRALTAWLLRLAPIAVPAAIASFLISPRPWPDSVGTALILTVSWGALALISPRLRTLIPALRPSATRSSHQESDGTP